MNIDTTSTDAIPSAVYLPDHDAAEAQRREQEATQQRLAEGKKRLAARLAADPSAAARCARILAALASDPNGWWSAGNVVSVRNRVLGDSLDETTTEADLFALFEAGLLLAEEHDDGDGEGMPSAHWLVYSVFMRDELDRLLLLGAERWLALMMTEPGAVPTSSTALAAALRRHADLLNARASQVTEEAERIVTAADIDQDRNEVVSALRRLDPRARLPFDGDPLKPAAAADRLARFPHTVGPLDLRGWAIACEQQTATADRG